MSNTKKIKLPFKSIGVIGGMQEEKGQWTKAAWVEVGKGRRIAMQEIEKLTDIELRAALQCFFEVLSPLMEAMVSEAVKRGLMTPPPMPDMMTMPQGDA